MVLVQSYLKFSTTTTIKIFDYIGYFTRIECRVLKIVYGALIMAKWSKIYEFHILDNSTIISHPPLVSQDFHDKIKLWYLQLAHVQERNLVGLAK